MKRVTDISEALSTVDTADGSCELRASNEAGYDETTGRLVCIRSDFTEPNGTKLNQRKGLL